MKHLISIKDLSREEIEFLFNLTDRVKKNPPAYADRLKGMTLGLIFEKPSTRTWASFQAGMNELGGESLYLGPHDIAMGKREEVRDIARVLSSYLAVFVLRTFLHRTITEFARYSAKPVINGLSNISHPCQALTDVYTILETFGKKDAAKINVVYVGDGNNVLNSLLLLFAKTGLTLRYATPRDFAPKAALLKTVKTLARRSGAKISAFTNPREAVRNAQVIYTDVWASMGEENQAEAKKKNFRGFQINQNLLRGAAENVKVMHCLPAHRGEEITNQVMEGSHSLIFQQAANRLPVQKAILLYLLTSIGSNLEVK
ncbi:MAG: ornithine carbamoyltransferase [Candidatus Omnitrophica bacterium]|nr:ornithine carbamoyltransferase [Candidatus Omnitrophota bacterium]